MKLAQWMSKHGWTNARLADACGVSEEAARLYRLQLRRPAAAPRAKIIQLTGNQVTREDLSRKVRRE